MCCINTWRISVHQLILKLMRTIRHGKTKEEFMTVSVFGCLNGRFLQISRFLQHFQRFLLLRPHNTPLYLVDVVKHNLSYLKYYWFRKPGWLYSRFFRLTYKIWNPKKYKWRKVKYFKHLKDVSEHFNKTVHFVEAVNNLIPILFSAGMCLVGVHVQGPAEKVSKHARLYVAKKWPEENTTRYLIQCAAEQSRPIPYHKTVTRLTVQRSMFQEIGQR